LVRPPRVGARSERRSARTGGEHGEEPLDHRVDLIRNLELVKVPRSDGSTEEQSREELAETSEIRIGRARVDVEERHAAGGRSRGGVEPDVRVLPRGHDGVRRRFGHLRQDPPLALRVVRREEHLGEEPAISSA
jgi:hypothetical protein